MLKRNNFEEKHASKSLSSSIGNNIKENHAAKSIEKLIKD